MLIITICNIFSAKFEGLSNTATVLDYGTEF